MAIIAMSYDKAAALRIKSWLLSHGLTENGTYGLMANIYCESGFRANNLQNSFVKKLGLSDEQYTAAVDSGEYTNFVRDSAGYGLCQWTFWSRKEALLNFRNQTGRSIGDENMQLEYLMYEFQKKYPTIIQLLTTSNDERECAIRVMLDFERPANQTEANQQKRANYASQLKEDLGGPKMTKIALDAGHGYNTPGKRCPNAEQTREWWLNDRVIDKVERKLALYECETLRLDDTTGATDVPKEERVKKSNEWGADVVVSCHHNAGAKGTNSGGTVVYHYCSSSRGINMAADLYKEIVARTGLVGNRASQVVKSNLYLLMYTDTYAYLIENGFMDSAIDMDIILTEAHAEKTAEGIISFLVNNFNLTKKAVVVPSTPAPTPVIPKPEPEPEVEVEQPAPAPVVKPTLPKKKKPTSLKNLFKGGFKFTVSKKD